MLSKKLRTKPCEAQKRFEELSAKWRQDHPMRVVPVIGSGVNIQAARMAGAPTAEDWTGLLGHILRYCNLSTECAQALPEPFIQRWEAIVRLAAVAKRGWQPFRREKELQQQVQKQLRKTETTGGKIELHSKLINAGFRDIISLNFDQNLARSAPKCKFMTEPPNLGGADQSPLYRHHIVPMKGFESRIWYPHGDTQRYDTIKLGVRRYGLYINHLEKLRGRYMQAWYKADEEYKLVHHEERWAIPPQEWDRQVRDWTPQSWVNVFLSAPLLFVGCGLSTDEWPLWWLLNQRARQNAYLEQERGAPRRPPTVLLTAGDRGVIAAPHYGAYVENVHFETFEQMWGCVMGLLEGAG